ncbi:hypothetical protein GJ496_003814 [Pomphorhynchus laevis]|nr:hypothetical protein GJ496_003814 [Pomphorhynchus laevis]
MRVNSRESLAVVLNSNYTHMNGNAEETSPSISPPSPLQTRSRGRSSRILRPCAESRFTGIRRAQLNADDES